MVFLDLWLNYDDFTLTKQTNANTKDSCGIANEYVVRLEGITLKIQKCNCARAKNNDIFRCSN